MARGSFSLRIDVDKLTLQRILAKFGRSNPLFGNDLRQVLDDTSAEIAARARRRAPVGQSRQLVTSIRRQVDSGSVPLWAKVTADAANNGFRYGWALQGSQKVAYRYRSGSRVGRRTRKWFTGALGGVKRLLARRLDNLGRKVESRWQR